MAHGGNNRDKLLYAIEDTLRMGKQMELLLAEAEAQQRQLTSNEKRLIEEYNQRTVMLEYITGIRKQPRVDSPRVKDLKEPVFEQIKK